MIALPARHIPRIPPLLLSMTHWERSITGLLTIIFLKSASCRGKGMGDNGQARHFPQEPRLNAAPGGAARLGPRREVAAYQAARAKAARRPCG